MMHRLFYFGWVVLLGACFISCKGQTGSTQSPTTTINKNTIVGGGCDGCELMWVGTPATIHAVDTSAGWAEKGQRLLVTGIVYQLDGKTPAPHVLLYYWQTDNQGLYSPQPGMDEKAKRHGHIRGWVKTDEQGRYAIYTIRPAPYPNENIPAHIHVAVKEPAIDNEYYIDELVFDDDKLLTGEKRKALENRGGSGILRVLLGNEMQIAEHPIILGLHIPQYPITNPTAKASGLSIGEDQPSFIPFHAYGPDKGTRTCPVCKYGRFHGIVYFVGSHPNWTEIKQWLVFLEQESVARQQYLKAYFVYGNEKGYSQAARQKELTNMGQALQLKQVALTFVPSMADTETEAHLNKINPAVENTFILYRHRTIVDKWIGLKPTADNFQQIKTALNNTKSAFFNLAEPGHD
jgi:protocatechuate 3,4-dioxygenase, beta subunit